MRESALEEIVTCPNLPSLPAVALEVLELTQDREVRLEEIAEVVRHDPALTAKILKTVNSSYYGLSKPCPTISRALVFLGLSTVKSLVLSFALVDLTKGDGGGVDLPKYWRRSLLSASAARRMAARLEEGDAEEAFVAALMQDIGMLALQAARGEAYGAVIGRAGGDHRRLPEVERSVLGYDHAEVGAALGARWRLPASLVEAIRRHHAPLTVAGPWLVRAVVFGAEAGSGMTLGEAGPAVRALCRRARESFGLREESLQELLQSVGEDAEELAGLLEVRTGRLPDVNRILAQAEEASLEHQIAMQREKEHLQRKNDDLAVQALTDGLTGLANRRRFDRELPRRLEAAVSRRQPVGLLLVDADRFKTINDTHGHQAGDEVLVALAGRLAGVVGEGDIVCRYGGEEFAVILCDCPVQETAAMAEALRRAISDRPMRIATSPEELSVTVSIGAAMCVPGEAGGLCLADDLIAAADRALYAAKAAGRNRVRVFGGSSRTPAV